MTKIQIKSRYGGSVLFEYEKDNNTIKDTLLEAIKIGANLSNADLRDTDLRNADLSNADLRDTDLRNADLSNANLRGADLCGANMHSTNLYDADLRDADLRGADLRDADLRGADLHSSDLSDTDLRNADLSNANLRGADLHGTNLRATNLLEANLYDTDLIYADLLHAYTYDTDLRNAKNILETEWYKQCMQNLLFIMSYNKTEVSNLKKKLLSGQVDGTQYAGDCCCLIGSLGNGGSAGVDRVCQTIPFYTKGLHNYGEQRFYQIREGDTDTIFVKEAIKCCDIILNQTI